MTAVNLDVTVPPFQANVEDTKTMSLLQIVRQKEEIEADKETAINHFLRKLQRIKAKINLTQNILASKIVERERLRKATAEKYIEESKKGEMNLPPKFKTG
ncbi:uncharacterized protein TNCT_58321 [Trichonephila clavata]|uniref:Uncharacterized protein n=1 Tax=Trichonephila clavata TaxID=2740835 RepID=A0A8X6G699_TRICU|nr:uncharacterized protein TNCT_58321 [Trichonephila clavata]